MRLAVIDLGTNSARLTIHEMIDGESELLHKEKIRISLGTSVFNKGLVDFKHLGKTLSAFQDFVERLDAFDVDHVSAMATSALREAQNGEEVRHIIEKKTGINIEIISGQKEAHLIAKGVLANEDLTKGSVGLIDIGGGSTEISLWENEELQKCESFALGGLRFQELVLKAHPPEARLIRQTRQQVARVLSHRIRNWKMNERVFGTGGTIKVLGKVLTGIGHTENIQKAALSVLIGDLSKMNLDEISNLPGMTEGKAPIILAGAIILEETMTVLGINFVTPTKYSLKDGILASIEDELRFTQALSPEFGHSTGRL
jgi:exopolyphosphatase / guanosine-5'-triphosphate,3'-diphosphate pyrophosphatase